MTAGVMIEVTCDYAGCERYVREAHWVGMALHSMCHAKLRRLGWLTVKRDRDRVHFCPDHRENPEPDPFRTNKRAKRAEEWIRA